jgi:hypothetical protein
MGKRRQDIRRLRLLAFAGWTHAVKSSMYGLDSHLLGTHSEGWKEQNRRMADVFGPIMLYYKPCLLSAAALFSLNGLLYLLLRNPAFLSVRLRGRAWPGGRLGLILIML